MVLIFVKKYCKKMPTQKFVLCLLTHQSASTKRTVSIIEHWMFYQKPVTIMILIKRLKSGIRIRERGRKVRIPNPNLD